MFTRIFLASVKTKLNHVEILQQNICKFQLANTNTRFLSTSRLNSSKLSNRNSNSKILLQNQNSILVDSVKYKSTNPFNNSKFIVSFFFYLIYFAQIQIKSNCFQVDNMEICNSCSFIRRRSIPVHG
jgi:hypothetical protein